jgi:hypothetical protein
MPCPTISPDLITSHYTRVAGTGEAANWVSPALLRAPDAPTQPKEIIMTRIFVTAAALALAISTAQAETSDQLAARVHDAAVMACAPEHVDGANPNSHYGAIDNQCIYRLSQTAMAKYLAGAKTNDASRLANK